MFEKRSKIQFFKYIFAPMKSKVIFKIGDKVSVVNDTLEGEIVQLDENRVTISCQDGFLYKFQANELVQRKEWKNLISKVDHQNEEENNKKKSKYISKKGTLIS